jgi:hypothetical protein
MLGCIGHEVARKAAVVSKQLPVHRHQHPRSDVACQAGSLAKVHVADDVLLRLPKEVTTVDR